jgi:hypothetical protein
MSPMTLLRLWKERWGMPTGASTGVLRVTMTQRPPLGGPLPDASLWSVRGVSLLALALAIPMFAVAVLVPTDLPGQSVFALVLVTVATAVRCHAGRLASLVLLGLCALAGARYLAWRWGTTLPGPPLALYGWALWLAEAVVWIAWLLWLSARLAPLTRPSAMLADAAEAMAAVPGHTVHVDVVVIAGQSSRARVRHLVRAALAQRWPAECVRVFLQDADGLRAWRADTAHVAPAADPVSTLPTSTPCLPSGNGAFILQVDADGPEDQLDDPTLLRYWLAWMQREPQLAMLHGVASALAPAPCALAREQLQATPGAGVTLLRRSAVVALPAGDDECLADRLHRDGHRIALMGLGVDPAHRNGTNQTSAEWLRIDAADDVATLRRRSRLRALAGALRRPTRLALRVMALAALALPAFGLLLVDAALSWSLAYALPYAALVFLTWSRAVAPVRQSLIAELRDWMLALVLPLFTTLQVLGESGRKAPGVRAHARQRIDVMVSWIYIVVLTVGTSRLIGATPGMRPWLIVACLGVVYAVLLRVSAWAVEEERRALRAEQAAMRFQMAELQIADHAPVEVEIVNFPEQPVRLRPSPAHEMATAAATLRLRDASRTALLGRYCLQHGGGGALFTAEGRDAAQLSAIGFELQMRFLSRHHWLPGSRLSAVLRDWWPLRPRSVPDDGAPPGRTASSP